MLTEPGCLTRRARLWQRLPAGVNSVLITAPQQLMYFANFDASPYVFNSQEASAALLLTRDGEAILIADNPQGPFSQKAFVSTRVEPLWYRCVEAAPHRGRLLADAVVELLKSRAPGVLGIEASRVPFAICDWMRVAGLKTEFRDVDADIRALRRKKEPDELNLIIGSLRSAERALATARKEIRPGMTELDVYRLVLRVASEAAGEPVLVYGDFVSGPRCEEGGGPASDRVIGEGELVLLDYSVVSHGYRGDFCVTFVCAGKATPKQLEMYNACLAALKAGAESLRPGVTGREVYAACRQPLVEAGLAAYFPHHAGHGVGLGHPEPPYLVPESDEVVEVGDVVTLEPGLYIPGVGGMRYEHNFVITETGSERISEHSLEIEN